MPSPKNPTREDYVRKSDQYERERFDHQATTRELERLKKVMKAADFMAVAIKRFKALRSSPLNVDALIMLWKSRDEYLAEKKEKR